MSFFANPLAEEEEVVPPDYPLEQYDERKREDDFNELLVRSTKLEATQAKEKDGAPPVDPDLVASLLHTQAVRASLEDVWQRISDLWSLAEQEEVAGLAVPRTASESPASIAARNAAGAQLQRQVYQRQQLVSRLQSVIQREARQIGLPAISSAESPTLPERAGWMTRTCAALQSQWLSEKQTPPVRPSELTERVQKAIQDLETHLPSMTAEEATLAMAAAQHLQYGLQSWSTLEQHRNALRDNVTLRTQEQMEALLAAEVLAEWAASKKLATSEEGANKEESITSLTASPSTSSPSSTCPEAPFSFDLALAESLNRRLSEENQRLETKLARLLPTCSSSANTSELFTGSALVQYMVLTAHARDLETEVEHLGQAVLYLREFLADPLSQKQWDVLLAEETENVTPPTGAGRKERLFARLQRIHAVELELLAQLPEVEAGQTTIDNVAHSIVLKGVEKLVKTYDICLDAMMMLSTHFERLSGNASFLRCAMRNTPTLDDAMVERVLDVPQMDEEQFQQRLKEMSSLAASLPTELADKMEKATAATSKQLALWGVVKALLEELLEPSLSSVQDPEVTTTVTPAAASPHEATSSASPRDRIPRVQVETDWVEGLLREETEEFVSEKEDLRRQWKTYWEAQQVEAQKKMLWVSKQPNASLLEQLCSLERENEELRRQLEATSLSSDDPVALREALDALRGRVSEEVEFNAAMQGELEALTAEKRSLEEKQKELLFSLSS